MADLRVIIEVDYGRETAESGGGSGLASTATVPVSGALIAHPDGGGGLLGRIPAWVGWEPMAANIEVEPRTNAWLNSRAINGDTRWWIEGQGAGLPDHFPNTRQPLTAAWSLGTGQQIIEPAIQIDGLALAQAGAPATFRGSVEFRRLLSPSTSGQLLLGDYADDTEMNPAPDDLSAYVERTLNRLRFAGSRTNVGDDANPRVALSCNGTFADPWGRVWLGPVDIGVGPGQLPVDIPNQSAARLRLFPSIFLRRASTVRGIRAAQSASQNPVTTPESAARLIVTRTRPAFSRWRLLVDKRLADVWIEHPGTEDLRTPLEVWNTVIVGDALGRAHADPFPVWRFIPDLPAGRWAQQGCIARNTFLEAAVFVGFADEEGAALGEDQADLS